MGTVVVALLAATAWNVVGATLSAVMSQSRERQLRTHAVEQ
jgi:hypothetical protein